MGKVLMRALAQAGLTDLYSAALSGEPLGPAQLERLAAADLLLVAGLADCMRAQFHGDEVRIVKASALGEPELLLFRGQLSEHGATGADLLRELALLRLGTQPRTGIAVSMETLGLELAQTALLFGADTLVGDLGSERTLPLLDGADARRREVEGLIARSGRSVRSGQAQVQAKAKESRP